MWELCELVHIDNPTPLEATNSCEAMILDRPLNGWYFPDYGKATSKLVSLRYAPVLDLNNLRRYAFPKVLEKYDIKMFSFYDDLNNKIFWFVHIIDRTTGEVEFANIEGCEELKEALAQVLYQVLKESKDG